MAKKENIYTHIEDTMSNIYLNGNMLNSGTVIVLLEEKDQRIKELDKQLAIHKRALELACEDNKRAYELQYLKNDVNIGSVDAFKSEYLRKAKEELEEQK